MRLKTLRKERPAFENEGAVISGSRMDLSNSELKTAKYRSNNSFALPTSLSSEVSSLDISPSNQTPPMHINHSQSMWNSRRPFVRTTPSQATHTSSYQAIEAAYLEHGIRIHLNSNTTVATTQQQNISTENFNREKSTNSIQRQKAFVNRNPSRTSSVLNFATTVQETQQDSRPFSALQQTSTVDFDQINTHDTSYVQPTESRNPLQLTNNYCSSSTLASEQSDHVTLSTQLAITNGTTSTETSVANDPDLAYMSSLLKTTTGDSFRDTIRRRAGLRATFAVHRHPQFSTPSNSKPNAKSSPTQSPPSNHRNSLLRNSTIAVAPTIATPSSKKVEKDILKHASRIRTNQIRDSFLRHQTSLRSQTNEQISSIAHSSMKINPPTKRTQLPKPSKSISLEPLELLLASQPHTLPPSPARATSLPLHDRSAINYQGTVRISRPRTKSLKIAFAENNNGLTTNTSVNEQLNSLIVNDDNLLIMKTSPIDLIPNDQTRQSNSSDSGCYDRSSSSGDTRSITPSSINRVPSSLPAGRFTSASTRRSNINKKVSFEDQPSTVLITTATYV